MICKHYAAPNLFANSNLDKSGVAKYSTCTI